MYLSKNDFYSCKSFLETIKLNLITYYNKNNLNLNENLIENNLNKLDRYIVEFETYYKLKG